MASTESIETSGREQDKPRRRRFSISWPVIVAIGWLIYEATALPALAIVFVCAKFGWEDFRAATWLRRMDPQRSRGCACFWLYLASALWKTAVTAVAAMFLTTWIVLADAPAAGPKKRQVEPPAIFISACLTTVGGFALSAIATVPAIWLAWRHRLKLWLGPVAHRARRNDLWPPNPSGRSSPNQAERIVLASLIVLFVPLLISSLIAFASLAARPKAIPPALAEFIGGLLVAGVVLTPIVLLLFFRDLLLRKLAASCPEECWGIPENSNVQL